MSILQYPKSKTVHSMGLGVMQFGAMHPPGICKISKTYADQPAKTRETPYRNHVLPLLNGHGSKQLIYKNVVCISNMFCAML